MTDFGLYNVLFASGEARRRSRASTGSPTEQQPKRHRPTGRWVLLLLMTVLLSMTRLMRHTVKRLIREFYAELTEQQTADAVNLQLLERKLFAGEPLTEADRTAYCRLLRELKGVHLAACTEAHIIAYFRSDSAYVYDFEPPNRKRHWGPAIPEDVFKHRHAKDKNSVADLSVNFERDIEFINRGLAEALPGGRFELPNGRIYSRHQPGKGSKRLYPVSGPGIHVLDRWQLVALGNMNKLYRIKHPQKDSIIRVRLRKYDISEERLKAVLDLFKLLHPND